MARLTTQVVGVVNVHLQSRRLNLGPGFDSLYRVGVSSHPDVETKIFVGAVQEHFNLKILFFAITPI